MTKEYALKLDLPLFTNLLSVAARCGAIDWAFEILKQMKDEGVQPCIKAYSLVITSYNREMVQFRNKNPRRQLVMFERAFVLLEEIQQSQIKLDQTVFNVLLSVCEETEEIKKTIELYRVMDEQRVVSDLITYSITIRSLTKSGRPDEAIEIVERALSEGRCNSPRFFASAIEASFSIDYNNARKVRDVWEQLYIQEMKPDAVLLSTLIRMISKVNEVSDTFRFYIDLERIGLESKGELQSAMIISCVQSGEKEFGFEILNQLAIKKDKSVLKHLQESKLAIDGANFLTYAYAQEGSLENIYKTLIRALQLGMKLNDHTYNALIKACFECGEGDLAIEFYDNLRLKGSKLN
jgi:pentatricopeptide repeat protein